MQKCFDSMSIQPSGAELQHTHFRQRQQHCSMQIIFVLMGLVTWGEFMSLGMELSTLRAQELVDRCTAGRGRKYLSPRAKRVGVEA